MSWTDWPPTHVHSPPNATGLSTYIQNYDFLRQLHRACWERANAAQIAGSDPYGKGLPRHPPPNMVWESGTITDATATTITDTTKAWDVTGSFNNPWRSVNVFGPSPPAAWDVIIDDCDERKVIHTTITYISVSNTIVVGDMTKFVTGRVVPSLASLVGKRYYIIKRGGKWWSERVMEWPNTLVYATGVVATGTIGINATITDSSKAWTVNQWAGTYDVMYRAAGDMKRGQIASNTVDTLTFPWPGGPIAAGPYYIVARDARFEWERIPGDPGTYTTPAPYRAWYRGVTEAWYSHYPNDSDPTKTGTNQPISTTQKPKLTLPVLNVFPDPTVFDIDYWTAPDDIFNEPDDPKGPDLWKTLRQIQVFIERLAGSQVFVDPTKSYSGLSMRPVGLTAAQLFYLAGINSQISRTSTPVLSGDQAGSIRVPLSMPSGFGSTSPVPVYYAILADDEAQSVLAHGSATWQSGVLIGPSFANTEPDSDPLVYIYAGKKIVISLGWTRWVPREFPYIYDKYCWIPDYNPDRDGPGAGGYQDPPTDAFPGAWRKRAKSTYFISHSALGFTGESTEARDKINRGGSLSNGTVARFVGDNWNDPSIRADGADWFKDDVTTNLDLLQAYNRLFTGKHKPTTQDLLDAQLSGTASGGDIYYLEDTAQFWWSDYWYDGGTLHSETGTATGGTTLSLIDTTKSASLWWDSSRAHLLGAILEVTIAGTVYYRPITGHDGTTLTFDYALPATASGKSYQIRLPMYEKNRFIGRTLEVTYADLTTTQRAITHSDDHRIWVLPPLEKPVVSTTQYRIIEYVIGGCHELRDGRWVEPSGRDPRSVRVGDGRPVNWLTDARNNLPHMVKEYGRYMLGDYLLKTQLEELYWALNFLIYTLSDFEWATRQNPTVAEQNNRANFRVNGGANFANPEADFSTDWADPFTPPTSNPVEGEVGGFGTAPIAVFSAHSNAFAWGNPNFSTIIRCYGYGSLNVGNGGYCPIASTTDFYVMTVAPFTDLSPTPLNPSLTFNNECGQVFDDGVSIQQWVFDANGDAVECGVFSLFSSANFNYDSGTEGLTLRRSGRLGSNGSTPPNEPTAISTASDGTNRSGDSTRGWEAVQWFAVTRWSFTYMVPVDQLPVRPMASSSRTQPGLDDTFLWFFQ